MKVDLESGKYVVAVSGGVDSVALLHLLKDLPDVELVVAHFDHGIREDSAEDRRLVQELAEKYELPFEYTEGKLGHGASEAEARKARYDFLKKIQKKHKARAIITAHHQDDVLETAIINLLRGTGRKGLTSLSSRAGLERPLLGFSKQQLVQYAKDQGLQWREDSTNNDQAYLRNYVRHNIVPKLDTAARQRFLVTIKKQRDNNREIDTLLVKELGKHTEQKRLDRRWFNDLPHNLAREVMAAWLRDGDIRDFDSKGIERLVVAGKTAKPGDAFDVLKGVKMVAHKDNLALVSPER